jgi:thiamine-monophosphate kinase
MAGQEPGYLSKEQQLIGDIRSVVGDKFLGDDCAYVAGGLLLTTDTLLEGSHFLLELSDITDIGFKAMAVNLSDIAAMAGRPRFALVALTVPPNLSRKDFLKLYEGMAECARQYEVAIVGGDITSGPLLSITISIVGSANEYGCLTRSGAQPGDAIVVTGEFGLSSGALAALLAASPQALSARKHRPLRSGVATTKNKIQFESLRSTYPLSMERHFRPTPRLLESWQFVKRAGQRGALMDASDGLADALAQIAQASNVGMEIELTEVPMQKETEQIARSLKQDPMDLVLYGGEDYELVGCLAASVWQTWSPVASVSHAAFKKIGRVTDSGRIDLLYKGRPGPKLDLEKCFQHLAKVD